MSGWLVAVTGVIYAAVAVEQLVKGSPHMAIVYAGYAFSNVGLFLVVR